ncbi:MAG: hypothetical protein HY331_12305 [Chloroflexi bacterium]|nr:hypothetical protein [Chloroflexota bacterium]
MGRWILMMVSGIAALAVFYPMVRAAWGGDTVALVFAAVVVVAVLSNVFATRSFLRKRAEGAGAGGQGSGTGR